MRRQAGAALCALLSLIGLGICVYLEIVHLGLLRGDLIGGSACSAAGTAFNCHAVTTSPIGTVLGLPLALWGAVGYLVMLGLAIVAWRVEADAPRAFAALFGLSLACVIADAALLAVMLLSIHYLCPLCLGTYAVNVLMVVVSYAALRQPWSALSGQWVRSLSSLTPDRRAPVTWVIWAVGLTGLVGAFSVQYAAAFAVYGPPGNLRKQMTQFVSKQPRVTVDTARDPQKGAADGALRLVEFSDFFCPSCQRASQLMPVLLSAHHDAAFSFKNFPLDPECNRSVTHAGHAKACRVAAAGECAHEQGKFWPFHDLVFQETPNYKAANVERDAQRAGLDVAAFRACMDSGRGMAAVARDVEDGIAIGVSSTPTFVVNGVPVTGVMAPATFATFVSVVRSTPPPAPVAAPAQAPAPDGHVHEPSASP
ncbi:MAG: thioredoxin domain-containing protein [Candidatus Omnitrophica bacterium]|nr:thioredoxin domain-containing protein [Candidatus Omnitrophota bacterium]